MRAFGAEIGRRTGAYGERDVLVAIARGDQWDKELTAAYRSRILRGAVDLDVVADEHAADGRGDGARSQLHADSLSAVIGSSWQSAPPRG